MRILRVLALPFALAAALGAAPVEVLYDASLADPDPVSQGWEGRDVTVPGTDGDADGRIDAPANVGAIVGPEGTVWQIHDQLEDGALNRPEYVVPLGKQELAKMYYDGWEFEFRVKLSNATPGYAGFCGWGVAPEDDPGWGIGAVEARIGFVFHYGDNGEFLVEPSGYPQLDLGPGSAAEAHTIRVVGSPESPVCEYFIDGVSRGNLDLSAIQVAGSYRGVMISAGSSGSQVGVTDWKTVSLASADRGFEGEVPVGDSPLPTVSANLEVVENDGGNANGSVTVSVGEGSSPGISDYFTISNRGDFGVTFPAADDVGDGVLIASLAKSSAGGPDGAPSAVSVDGSYYIALHDHTGAEANSNVSLGWFDYRHWLGAHTANEVDGGPLSLRSAHPEIRLGVEFVDHGNGTSTVDLRDLNARSDEGILLVNHTRNEANFALSQANEDGTFTIFNHDLTVTGAAYEQDPVGFVYLPLAEVGNKGLVALGRIEGNAATAIGDGSYTLAKAGTGTWHLQIPGHSPATGVLLVSPEGGDVNNVDNILSSRWDGTRWIIESRDLPAGGLQDPNRDDEDIFSFAFLENPNWRRTIRIDSTAGTIEVDEDGSGFVDQGGMFRGTVPYTASVSGGLATFTFAGDLALLPTDHVRGTGDNAISVVVSGDLTIPEGAIVDVSATDAAPGPGGGLGGNPPEGGDGGGGIGADAGQRHQPLARVGKAPAVFRRHGAGAFQQVARAGVISEPRPFAHHPRVLCRREIGDGGPERGEPFEIAAHGGHGRLLQHHLGQPDAVGIGPQAAGAIRGADAPGQIAGVAVIPRQKRARIGMFTHSLSFLVGNRVWYRGIHRID